MKHLFTVILIVLFNSVFHINLCAQNHKISAINFNTINYDSLNSAIGNYLFTPEIRNKINNGLNSLALIISFLYFNT
jgi:hypothetical protein